MTGLAPLALRREILASLFLLLAALLSHPAMTAQLDCSGVLRRLTVNTLTNGVTLAEAERLGAWYNQHCLGGTNQPGDRVPALKAKNTVPRVNPHAQGVDPNDYLNTQPASSGVVDKLRAAAKLDEKRLADSFPNLVDDRNRRIDLANETFKDHFREDYGDYVINQRKSAFSAEQLLPANTRQALDSARKDVVDLHKVALANIEAHAKQIVVNEAPMRAAILNPETKDPGNFVRAEPRTQSEPPIEAREPSGNVTLPVTTTFPTLNREALLRQQLEAERRYAIELDKHQDLLLRVSGAATVGVIAGKAAAEGIEVLTHLPAGFAYDAIIAIPDVILGNKSASEAVGGLVGGQVAGSVGKTALKTAGAPPFLGNIASVGATSYSYSVDWLHQYRTHNATRTK